MSDIDQIAEILQENADKSFVKRILNPNEYPVLDNGDGTYSTHSMAWVDADGKYYVYPTVLLGPDGQLHRLSGEEAWRNAQGTGNFIEFNNPEKADWFSKNYKRVWRK